MLKNQIAIIGAGTMGQGIAQVFAQNGARVFIMDRNSDILKSGIKFNRKY
jgi:3-hydroxybutyryl-CoA dehydrogenase